ncbi:ATP-binding cassette domain-containing protein [Streptococcus sobrinus]|uniref:ATP-binding cassette domain-containing protein n=1 Tax=Streptococcus sobrinus TaxID=1310 RepID=UPI000D707E84|nr:ABC transporter ATP-binding protein [Streptococcus sobrinus]AWN61154.1 ABC transporter ATP-binding protein [Streptococcus sobrinus]AWN63027.1 ABC transporter ATP-binding protein [Streptococcus sobrinus]SQG19137.1 ABC transporter [Streptococcus sobrinus]
MTVKEFWRDIPKVKMMMLLLAMILAGCDGIVMSQVVSSVTKFNSSSSYQEILVLFAYGVIFYLLVQVASMIVNFLNNNIIKQLNEKYKMSVMKAFSSNSNLKMDSGDVISILTVDLPLIEEKYFAIILGSAYYFFMGLISLLYLVYLSPVISLLFIICSLFPMIPSLVFVNVLGKATDKYTSNNNKFIKNIKDFSQGYYEISTYHAFSTFLSRTQQATNDMESSSEQLRNKHAFVGFLSAMLSWLGYLIPISIALFLVVKGQLEAGAVIALFLASDRVIPPLRSLSENIRLIKSTKVTREKIEKVISEVNKKDETPVLVFNNADIVFEKVSFGFDKTLFRDATFTIPFGSKVLITGVSGSGKTTLLNLIQGNLSTSEGRIFLSNGMKQMPISSSLMSRIQQNPYYFELSLRDNLLMGLKDVDDTFLVSVLDKLGLIEELGDDCLERKYGEQGEQLSGGQKQRIEIARALIHNRRILLVDEATSSVDVQSAKKIRDLFQKLDVTVLEVAHHYDSEISNNYSHHLTIENNTIYLESL